MDFAVSRVCARSQWRTRRVCPKVTVRGNVVTALGSLAYKRSRLGKRIAPGHVTGCDRDAVEQLELIQRTDKSSGDDNIDRPFQNRMRTETICMRDVAADDQQSI